MAVKTVIIESLGLSKNESANVVDDATVASIKGLDGKLNVTEDGRKYFMALVTDGMFGGRNVAIMQKSAGDWGTFSPAKISGLVGKNIAQHVDFVIVDIEPAKTTIGNKEVVLHSVPLVEFKGTTNTIDAQLSKLGYVRKGATVTPTTPAVEQQKNPITKTVKEEEFADVK